MSNKEKKILLIDFHPDDESFCAAMTQKYLDGANKSGFETKKIVVNNLNFDPILHYGYRKRQELEPDLLRAQDEIKWCDHLVIVTPVWWGTVPALAKGFIDRIFISGFSHRFDVKKRMPVSLLKGRSATVLSTQGAPWFYSLFFTKDAFWKVIKRCILKFAGFNPVKRKIFDKVKSGNDRDREKILEKVYDLGKKGF